MNPNPEATPSTPPPVETRRENPQQTQETPERQIVNMEDTGREAQTSRQAAEQISETQVTVVKDSITQQGNAVIAAGNLDNYAEMQGGQGTVRAGDTLRNSYDIRDEATLKSNQLLAREFSKVQQAGSEWGPVGNGKMFGDQPYLYRTVQRGEKTVLQAYAPGAPLQELGADGQWQVAKGDAGDAQEKHDAFLRDTWQKDSGVRARYGQNNALEEGYLKNGETEWGAFRAANPDMKLAGENADVESRIKMLFDKKAVQGRVEEMTVRKVPSDTPNRQEPVSGERPASASVEKGAGKDAEEKAEEIPPALPAHANLQAFETGVRFGQHMVKKLSDGLQVNAQIWKFKGTSLKTKGAVFTIEDAQWDGQSLTITVQGKKLFLSDTKTTEMSKDQTIQILDKLARDTKPLQLFDETGADTGVELSLQQA